MVSNLLLSDEGSALLFVVIISIVKICLVSISYDRSISNLVMPFYIISCSMHIIKSFTIKVEDLKILEEDHDVQQTVLILYRERIEDVVEGMPYEDIAPLRREIKLLDCSITYHMCHIVFALREVQKIDYHLSCKYRALG